MEAARQAVQHTAASAVQPSIAGLLQADCPAPLQLDLPCGGGRRQCRVHLWLCNQGPTVMLPGVTAAARLQQLTAAHTAYHSIPSLGSAYSHQQDDAVGGA